MKTPRTDSGWYCEGQGATEKHVREVLDLRGRLHAGLITREHGHWTCDVVGPGSSVTAIFPNVPDSQAWADGELDRLTTA